MVVRVVTRSEGRVECQVVMAEMIGFMGLGFGGREDFVDAAGG